MADEADLMVPAREFNADAFLPEDLLDRWIRPLIAEFIGPFALVFIGAGAIMTAGTQGFNQSLEVFPVEFGLQIQRREPLELLHRVSEIVP